MPLPPDSLAKVQRLLEDGSFSSTYKHALLLALAELAIERGDDDGGAIALTARDLAEKFLEQYWEHVKPYPPHDSVEEDRIWQNSDKRAAVANVVSDCRERYGGSIARLRGDRAEWRRQVARVARTVQTMPLWKLQRVAGAEDDFLYPQVGRGGQTARERLDERWRELLGAA